MGYIDFTSLLNKPLKEVKLTPNKRSISFTFQDGSIRSFAVEGECCSTSWIEHLEAPANLAGALISEVFDSSAVPWDGHVCGNEAADGRRPCGHDCLKVYNTVFRTNKGDIVLEYRNDSNGYYGGYLVDA